MRKCFCDGKETKKSWIHQRHLYQRIKEVPRCFLNFSLQKFSDDIEILQEFQLEFRLEKQLVSTISSTRNTISAYLRIIFFRKNGTDTKMSSIVENFTNLKSKVYGIEAVGKQKWETLNENLISVQSNMDQMNISGQFFYFVT